MVENNEKIFLCNRWFYLVKETEDTLFYSTNKNQNQVAEKSVNLEVKKESNEIKIIYLKKRKTLGVIKTSDVTSYPINFHYSQCECEEIVVNGSNHTNLLIELFASIDGVHPIRDNGYEISFHKKKKMNNLCYQQPNFELDTILNIKHITIDSKTVKEFQETVSTFDRAVTKIKNLILNTNQKEEAPSVASELTKESVEDVKKLEVPQELMVYDRVYHLANIKDSSYIFENTEDGIYNLEIRIDSDHLKLTDVRFKIKKDKGSDGVVRIYPNDQNEIITSLTQRNIKEVTINHEVLYKASIKSLVVYNDLGDKISNEINIQSENGNYHLERHPHFCNFYVDGNGTLYSIGNSDYYEYLSICSSSYAIFHSIEKKLMKNQ